MTSMRHADRAIDRVEIVVPARDEAETLDLHLDALATAAARAQERWPGLDVHATLVLDSCTDTSAEVAARHPWIEVLEVDLGVVGLVRRAGIEHVRPRLEGLDPARVWLACTDADSVVSAEWLVTHLELAASGHGLVVGAVSADPKRLAPRALRSWRARHVLREGHEHVHGANLGLTLRAHDTAGGFAGLPTGEDVDLVERVRTTTDAWCATARHPVVTSARLRGRAPAGFAAYLLTLASSS